MTIEDRFPVEPYCYLTTTGRKTGQPREIEIWFAPVRDTIYLMNGGGSRPPGRADWVLNLQADPSARVRIGDEAFTGRARMVEFDSPEHERARELLVTKYASAEDDLARWRATGYPVAIELSPAG